MFFFAFGIFPAINSSIDVRIKNRPRSSILWVSTLIGLKKMYIGISGKIAREMKKKVFFSLRNIWKILFLKKNIAAKVVPKLQTSSNIGELRLLSTSKKYLKS